VVMTMGYEATRRQLLGRAVLGAGGVLSACTPSRTASKDVVATPSAHVGSADVPSRSGSSAPSATHVDAPTVVEAESAAPSATLVLVHGAWHRPGPTWDLVTELLRQRGTASIAVALPSAGARDGQRPGLAEDIVAVTSAIEAVGGPVVLVGHSYGGMVVSGAGSHPAVRGLVYLAAFCLAEGETVLDIAAVDPPPLIASAIRFGDDGLMTIDPSLANAVFYADVPTGIAQPAIGQLVASTSAIFTTPQGPPAWAQKRSTYVVCDQDHAIPVFKERAMAQRCDETIVLQSSHSPFLSMPDRVAEILASAAQTGT
jgi:pimeloyl-ACP methyl ester carboxylesterase